MKALLGIAGGFVVSLGMFGGGLVFATTMLGVDEPGQPGRSVDVADLWSGAPRTVDPSSQNLERVAVALPAVDEATSLVASAAIRPEIDATTTGALDEEQGSRDDALLAQEVAFAAHAEWCSQRYRSYNPQTDTYNAYSGGAKICVSPHSDALAAVEGDNEDGYVVVADIAEDVAIGGMSSAHASNCASRYRSYDPSDNSYQPYGGGPRRQCE